MVEKRKAHGSIIEAAIESKGPAYSASSARTLRSDAMAILESLVVDIDDEVLMAALVRQGFRPSTSYLTTLHALAAVAKARRPLS
jgi:hypothetical protein